MQNFFCATAAYAEFQTSTPPGRSFGLVLVPLLLAQPTSCIDALSTTSVERTTMRSRALLRMDVTGAGFPHLELSAMYEGRKTRRLYYNALQDAGLPEAKDLRRYLPANSIEPSSPLHRRQRKVAPASLDQVP
jgi:hypothetical protein